MLSANAIAAIEKRLGYVFRSKGLLVQAFTRRSYTLEHREEDDNEVLELYGDAVLSLIVTTRLLERYADVDKDGMYHYRDEGQLSRLRSELTQKRYLSSRMAALGLQKYLRMSRCDLLRDQQNTSSVMEDLFESIVGAMYLDSGFSLPAITPIVLRMLDMEAYLDRRDGNERINQKNELLSLCRLYALPPPVYTHTRNGGTYTAICELSHFAIRTEATAKRRKEAENLAAKLAFNALFAYTPVLDREIVEQENALSYLREQCRKLGIPSTVRTEKKEQLWYATVKAGELSEEASAPTLKKAKQLASLALLRSLDAKF